MDIKSMSSTGMQAAPVPLPSDAMVSLVKANSAAALETAQAVQQPTQVPTMQQLFSAVKQINKAMADLSQGLVFSVDSDSQRVIVKVIDQQTKEVIRQIPSEETLQIAKALDQVKGLLLKQKA